MDKLDAALMVMELREEVEAFKEQLRIVLYLLRNGTIGVDEEATIATWAKLVGEE